MSDFGHELDMSWTSVGHKLYIIEWEWAMPKADYLFWRNYLYLYLAF